MLSTRWGWQQPQWESLLVPNDTPSFKSRVQAILEAQQSERLSPVKVAGASPDPAPAPPPKLSRKANQLIAKVPEAPEPVLVAQEAYTPDALVQYIIANPGLTHAQYAAYFGRKPSWFASVLVSAAFQEAVAPHREEIGDPYITASLEERFRGLAMHSLLVIGQKLDGKEVSDGLALEAAKLSTKALGMGTATALLVAPPSQGAMTTGAEAVAERIMKAMAAQKAAAKADVVDVEAVEVPRDGS